MTSHRLQRWLTVATPSLLITVPVFFALALVLESGPTLNGQEGPRGKAALINPEEAKEQAPATFRAQFDTSKGSFVVEVHREWAPFGADRFYNLVKRGYYDGNRFFYVTDHAALFGLSGEPEIANAWLYAKIPNDKPRVQSNTRGRVALMQQNGRATQTIIHVQDNISMDPQVTPFGVVVSGLNVIDNLYKGYGEMFPTGKAPTMGQIIEGGTAYLEKRFPMLDYVKLANIVP